ncbi:MAG: A17 family peptidase [Acidobacteria bacterium]|nr:A17 family peptidase [Acidobacteriota bacterium]
MTGPPFLNDMCSILIHFRVHKYGFSTDIEKAFLHVTLDEADRDFTRFLWLSDHKDPESKFQVYRFKVVLFGSVSSPFMLYAALHHHLTKNPSPISEDMQNNLYVDNVISGCNSESDVVHYYKKSRSIMSQANFNLRTWASNSTLLQNLAKRDGSAETSDIVKILGLQWNTSSDTLSLVPRNITNSTPFITKRDILQDSSRIFDPLGFVTPVTIQAKIFLQELWGKCLQWDEPLHDDLKNKWNVISQNIQDATTLISIPRQYFQFTPSSSATIHVFADASTKAYGAVVYLHQNNQISFIMSKTRVAPLKQLTLPRLELMGAVLAARLSNFILRSFQHTQLHTSIHLWSDSQIVLHWINSKKKLKQFVSH